MIIGVGAYFIGSLSRLVLNNQLPEGGVDMVIPTTLLTVLGDSNIVTTLILAVILILFAFGVNVYAVVNRFNVGIVNFR